MANDSIIVVKKKVVGHAAHHGGSWKVAYADFVTAMMAFFMVLWIMGLSDETKSSIQGYFNDPAGFMKNPPVSNVVIPHPGQQNMTPQRPRPTGSGVGDEPGNDPDGEKDTTFVKSQISQKTVDMQGMDHVVVTATTEGIQIEFLEDVTSVFFETGSAKISPLGQKIIKQVVPVVKDTGRFLVLEGHTDRKPYAGKEYTNWELSSERASAFRKQLAKDGIPDARFKEVRGYADKKLKFPGKPFAAGNRRVTLLLPWGKKAGQANHAKIEHDVMRAALGAPGPKFNIMAHKVSGPHL